MLPPLPVLSTATAFSASAPATAALPPAPLLSLRDETFDPTQPERYQLHLVAGPAGLRLLALDATRQKVVALEEYAQPATELPAWAAAHDLLGRSGWRQVRVALTGRAFTLLPAPLFRVGDEAAYLRPHYALAPAETACHYQHPAGELVSVFAADAGLAQWLRAAHGPAARLVHHTSALLAGLLHQRGAAAPRRAYLNVGPHELTLAVVGQQVEFCNVFPFGTAEDVVYYTILVMQELGLNPDQDELTLWGDLTTDSAVFALLSTYVRHLRFGSRPYDLQYSYRLNEVLEYRYFELFSLNFCE